MTDAPETGPRAGVPADIPLGGMPPTGNSSGMPDVGQPPTGVPGWSQPQYQSNYPAFYPAPYLPPPKRSLWWLWPLSVVVVTATVFLYSGLVWPGWMKPKPTQTASRDGACYMLSTTEVASVLDIGTVYRKELGKINDPASNTPIYSCIYAGRNHGGVVTEVGDFPAAVAPTELLHNMAFTGKNLRPADGVSDVAGFVSDLGGAPSSALIAIHVEGDTLHSVIIDIPTTLNVTDDQLTELVRAALAAN
jgi:hypothetical protein